MDISPTLSAIMCDGMGWFSSVDYKRMLLTYDEIHYLLPQHPVEYEGLGGNKEFLFLPAVFRENPSFKVHHFVPDDKTRQLILAAASADTRNPRFTQVVEAIPRHERAYAWNVVNADGDVGAGRSIGLGPNQDWLAHAILLNKFLLAADALKCIPITGKPYIHGLISEKYRFGVEYLRSERPDLLHHSLREGVIRHNPVAAQIVSALVREEELEQRTEEEIIHFKKRNRVLFERYSYTVRKLVREVSSLPVGAAFDLEVDELIKTDVWKEKDEIERELRSAWNGLFKNAVKSLLVGSIGMAIAPFFSLGAITLSSIMAASASVAPWMVSELADVIESRKEAQRHGIYYLLKFAS
jgi:hypothetical protein